MSDSKPLKLTVYEEIIDDPSVRELVWHQLESGSENEGPTVLEMDVMAARKYLKACLRNMSENELNSLTEGDAASLWARGALGAAKYRGRSR